MSRKYQVKYVILDKEYTSGPYESYDEAIYQKNDIAGYEGVERATIEPLYAKEEKAQ